MKPLPLCVSYREVLLTNSTMLVLLAVLYGSGRLSDNFVLLFAFLLVAVLFPFLELALCVRALFTRQFPLALVYSMLFFVVAKLDWWLWQQAE